MKKILLLVLIICSLVLFGYLYYDYSNYNKKINDLNNEIEDLNKKKDDTEGLKKSLESELSNLEIENKDKMEEYNKWQERRKTLNS